MTTRSLAALGGLLVVILGLSGCGGYSSLGEGIPRDVDLSKSYRPAVVSRPPAPKSRAGKPRLVRRFAVKAPVAR